MFAGLLPTDPTGAATMRRRLWLSLASMAAIAVACLLVGDVAAAPPDATVVPGPTAPLPAPPASGAQTALRVLALMTVLSLLPSIVLTMTCFTRIIVVFSFLRQALGVQGMPPNQVLVGMALFLSAFIMAPVATKVNNEALTPLMEERITIQEAFERARVPLSGFMLAHTHDEDLRLFVELSKGPRPRSRAEVSFTALVPAFVLSEIRTAFQMGFLVLLPFMVIDMVVSSVLMAMGMMMLPPALIALPLKIMIFVLADGWTLLVSSLARSFHT